MKPEDFPIPLRPNRAIELSTVFLHEMGGDHRLDYSLDSLSRLDSMLGAEASSWRRRKAWVMALLMGFYMGEVLLRRLGPARAAWARAPEGAEFPVHLVIDGAPVCLHQLAQRCVAEGGGVADSLRELLAEPEAVARKRRALMPWLARLFGAGVVWAATTG